MLRNEIAIMRALQVLLPRMLYCAAERGGLDEAIKAAVEIEEAARREAEAKPPVIGDAWYRAGLRREDAIMGEREGPDSAAAPPCTPHSAYCVTCGLGPCRKDKPTPAADELVTALDEIATTYGHSRIGRSAKAALSRIEAQARDLAGTQAIYRERDRAANEALFKLEATEARVRELEAISDANFRDAGANADRADAEKARADRLAAALQKIANHPHCVYTKPGDIYEIGVVDGHRCAATVAKEALSTEGGDRG